MMGARILLWVADNPLVVTANNVSGSNSGFAGCGNPGATNTPNVQVQGGSGSRTYLWELVSAPATRGPFVPTSPSVQNPSWRTVANLACASDPVVSELWRVTVTDTTTGQVGSKVISVQLRWTDLT